MKILVAYATSEGHTRKIARHVADRIADAGNGVELLPLADASEVDLARFDKVITAASVHAGHYQKSLAAFAAMHTAALNAMPTLFLSVSLAANGHDAEDWKALDRMLDDLTEATGWIPGRLEQIAGAYMPSQYNVIERFIMRRIIAAKSPDADLDADTDYTDWPALDAMIDSWLAT
ncbi:flavodoxin domain-containing protein [Alisedimentitalea sp. MJ-SS2]|uniref:flavodoxin domain-containing protein n=1 Tax=Aliisedimentitalea sp. MJ-SS2 TaxID=3049795 RepID=UPI00290BA37B|nr:flavodoxin domain-containing protein [Alisedimentitalea sp. MJ-SS2]MDU8927768.1 flavodoxin domain-containing protein [Alisedimentitalea sp. MJ-SS2]